MTTMKATNTVSVRAENAEPSPSLSERIAGSRYLGISAFLFAILQTLCPAVIAISAVRVFIGLGALAAAAGTDWKSVV